MILSRPTNLPWLVVKSVFSIVFKKEALLFMFLLFNFQNIASQIYVAPTASGSGNGSSWANASTIQNALANANANQILWLRRGTYAISTTLEIGYSQSGLQLFGGFLGTETLLSQRDWATNVTILDGLTTTQTMTINGSNCILDGITFVRGFVTGDIASSNTGGGAMYVGGGNNTIRNCTFRNNISTSVRGAGAMYIRNGTGHLVENCTFENNRNPTVNYPTGQNGGGAIHNWTGDVTISNSNFINNYSGQAGGAIYTWGQNLTLNNCTFNDNRSDDVGGAVHVNYYDVTFSNCSFQANQSAASGGAISNQNTIRVNNCDFNQNTAQTNGGAIYASGEVTSVINTNFTDNNAVRGGAVYSNNKNPDDANLSFANTLFYDNKAIDYGGAIYNAGEVNITNATFVNNTNTALVHSNYATTTYSLYSTNVYNSIFYNNTKNVNLPYSDIAPVNSNDNSDKDFRRNLLEENPNGVNNLVGVNPGFQNLATGNFRLNTTSPAIDFGNNGLYNSVSPTAAGASTDLGGNPRLFGTYIDAGAYERQAASSLTPPNCITTITPANNATNVAVDANIAWDSVATAVGYYISIGTTPGGSEIVNNANVTGTTYNPVNDFDEGTLYYVRITPYNTAGSASACVEYSFTTETVATVPNCTTLTLPLNGATNVSVSTNISWSTVSNATGYRLRVGTTATGGEILALADVGNVTTYNLPNDLPEGTTIYVLVRPYNATGNATGCSNESFTTEVLETAPNCTTLTLPLNGASDVSVSSNISWSTVSDATGYRLRVGTTATGGEILALADVGNVTTYNLPNDLPAGTTIYVFVRPYNAIGNATGCSNESFTTETVATVPNCTTITSPTNNATSVSISTNITWDAVTDVDGYYISIGTTSGGTDIVNNESVTGTSYNPIDDFAENTTYFVSVIPYNTVGSASGCSEISFTTETVATVPSCTSLTGPADDTTDVAVDTILEWNPVANADGYRLSVGTSSGGNNVVDNEDVSILTQYIFTEELRENTSYYITITPYNTAGDALGCEEYMFTTVAQNNTLYGLSPNGDGINDFWYIDDIELNPDNTVSIYNRWGDLVFQMQGYDNRSNIFNGTANKKTKIGASELPSGTYFFTIQVSGTHDLNKLQGFIVLKR